MFCNKCRNQINTGAAFCGKCGNATSTATVEANTVNNQRIDSGNGSRKKIMFGGAAIAAAMAVVIGIFVFGGSGEQAYAPDYGYIEYAVAYDEMQHEAEEQQQELYGWKTALEEFLSNFYPIFHPDGYGAFIRHYDDFDWESGNWGYGHSFAFYNPNTGMRINTGAGERPVWLKFSEWDEDIPIAIAAHFDLTDLNYDGIPEIFVLYLDAYWDSSWYKVFSYIDGAFIHTANALGTWGNISEFFFRDPQGNIILGYSTADVTGAQAQYVRVPDGKLEIERSNLLIFNWGGDFIGDPFLVEADWYFSNVEWLNIWENPGVFDITTVPGAADALTPLTRFNPLLTELQENVTQAVMQRLGR